MGNPVKLVTFDFETHYSSEYSLSKMGQTEYITDPRFKALNFALKVGDKPTINVDNPDVLRNPEVRELLNGCCLVCHHTQFDAAILAWHYDIHPRFYMCTMSMARPLGHLVTGVSLGALMEFYGLGKKGFLSPDSPPEERAQRAIIDVEGTYALAKLFINRLPEKELKLIDWTVRAYVRPLLQLDVTRAARLVENLAKQKQEMLDDLGVDKETLSSTPQFAKLLESFGIDVPLKKSNTSDDLIPALAKTDPEMQELLEDEDPRIQALCAARLGIKSTGDETRARRLLQAQERLPALPVYLNYCGAHTVRWSNFSKVRTDATGAVVPGTGEIRKSIVAPDNHILIVGDLAQIEARIVAWLAGETLLVEGFRDGRDLYCEFGSWLYRRPITKADVLERFISKGVILGSGYGMGWKKFKDTVRAKGRVEISEQLARNAIDTYRERYHHIPELWERMEHLLGNPGAKLGPIVSHGDKIELPDGNFLHYHELRKSSEGWSCKTRRGRRSIWGGYVTENVCQALARIIIADDIIELEEAGDRVATMSHDELVTVVPADQAVKAKARMGLAMRNGPHWAMGLPLNCDLHITRIYGEVK
jgi:DNA polymerase family A